MQKKEIKSLLFQLGSRVNKLLGQHFLVDQSALMNIIKASDIHPGDLVLEIGPGLGVLTRGLAAKGAEIIAIEKDKKFAEYVNSSTSSRVESVTTIHGDAATINWQELIGDRSWKLISNLPYSIASFALRKALWSTHPASKIIVLIQKEVAERAVALLNNKRQTTKTKKGSLLSLMVALASTSARILHHVSRDAFYPEPKVDSAILEIIPMSLAERKQRWSIDPEKIIAIAKHGFAHPRKLLRSNLRLFFPSAGLSVSDMRRAEDLSPDEWAELAHKLQRDIRPVPKY